MDQVVTEPKRNAITLFNIGQITFVIIIKKNTCIITLFQISMIAIKTEKDKAVFVLEEIFSAHYKMFSSDNNF